LIQHRSLNVQALALASGSGVAQVLVAVIYIFTARHMKPEEFGLIATAIALGMAGAGFVDLGTTSYWIRELASGRSTQEHLNPRMVTRLLVAFAVAAAVVAVAIFTKPQMIAAGVLLLSATTVGMILVPLRAAQRAKLVGLLTALDRTVAIIIYFALLALGVGPGTALWISIAVGDLCLVLYVGISERSQLKLNYFRLSNPWAGAKWYSLSTVSASAAQLDLPIVAAYAGASAAGIYGGVNRWTQPLALTTNAFASASVPFLASGGALAAMRRQVLRASWILATVIALCVGLMFAAPWVVLTLLGGAYASSIVVLQWLAGATLLNSIAQPLMVALSARRFDRLAATILLVSVGAQLTIVAILAPTLGALSAAIGLFILQVLQLAGCAGSVSVIALRRRRLSRRE